MKKVIFIHGYTSSPKKTKYQLIAKKLQVLEIDYSIPEMPGGEYPHSKNWLEIIDREVKKTSSPIVLVGHSLGTRAILLYLDKYQIKVDTVVLIAPLNNDYQTNRKSANGNFSDFFDYAINIGKVKTLADKFVIIHSKDDDLLDYNEQGVKISKELGTRLITYDGYNHFSGEENAERNASAFVEIVKLVL